MAGWSTFSNGSSLDCLGVETVGAFHGNACCLVKDGVDNDKVKQKYLFYQIFPVYLKDNWSRIDSRPVPVLLGDGRVLDLYKLFCLVKERGGYALVSKKGLWRDVTKELGFSLEILASVKLVYDKYLNDFERWLRKIFEEKKFRNGNHGCDWDFKSLPLDPEKEYRSLLSPNLKDKDDDEPVKLESNKSKKYNGLVNGKNDTKLLETKNKNNKKEDVQHVNGDDNGQSCYGVKDNLATLSAEGAEKEFNSRKRKRETLYGMLNWMRHIAKHPLDPLTQPIPKPSKWKEYKGQDLFAQILRAREVLLQRQPVEPNSGPSSLQKLKVHPAMYEDHVYHGQHAAVKLRCSERVPASVKSRLCSCCNPCSPNGSRLASSHNTEAEKCTLEKTSATSDLLTAKIMADPSGDDFIEKQVSVGPLFQAEVPEWTGEVFESDSKWLGTQIWPLKDDSEPATETDLLRRGRQEKCSCKFQGSVECVELHIAENRLKLKLELGSVFYYWGFDRMGEEVSLQWTIEEEKKFKDIMRSNIPSLDKSFWKNPSKYFPNKTRRNLVSYYFDVFLIQLRCYQNRVTPKNVDSDDDEAEFGSFGAGFGMEAVNGTGSNFLDCSENKQCIDLE